MSSLCSRTRFGIYKIFDFCMLVCDLFVIVQNNNSLLFYFQKKIRRRHIQKCDRKFINQKVKFICPSTPTYPIQLLTGSETTMLKQHLSLIIHKSGKVSLLLILMEKYHFSMTRLGKFCFLSIKLGNCQ